METSFFHTPQSTHKATTTKMQKSNMKVSSTCRNFPWSPCLLLILVIHVSLLRDVEAIKPPNNVTCSASLAGLNDRPVIGILTHPRRGYNGSYIATSYVKFVESGGARVIPLIYDEPWTVLSHKLDMVNGVLFTGGTLQEGPYVDVLRQVFQKVIEKNDVGDYFPCHAICIGFEHLLKIISQNDDILESTDAVNMKASLQFVDGVDITNSVFGSFPPFLRKKLEDDCLTMHYHRWGISKATFNNNGLLSNFFKVLATSKDRNEEVFVSTIQAHIYPITGYQWHPEKNAFEWGLSEIPHSLEAVQVTQYAANFFISEARKSRIDPPSKIILDNLIYKYKIVTPGNEGEGFEEMYIFDSSSPNTCLL